MVKLKDIYLRVGRSRQRYEFSMLKSHKLRLERLSAMCERSVPDLITEGISLVLLAYEEPDDEPKTEAGKKQ
jgi:hypothetical protein